MEINHLPLSRLEDDRLGFTKKAELIALDINNHPSYLPYAISVRGPWGAGKSTMLNFVESYLDMTKCSVIQFNSWMVTDKESLIVNLFEEIYYRIDGHYIDIKKGFKEYAKKIIPPVSKVLTYFTSVSQGMDLTSANMMANSAGEATKGVAQLAFEKPLSIRKKELYKEMLRHYQDNDKKIVVIIDEIDRLFPDELITIFQMIKAALDFPGIIFVVAMDESIICEALEKKGVIKSKEYLEKIFQKNYYINTQYQLQTLTDYFIVGYLGNKEPETKLLECINSYFYLKQEHFTCEHPSQVEIQENGLVEKYTLKTVDYDKLKHSYYKTHIPHVNFLYF